MASLSERLEAARQEAQQSNQENPWAQLEEHSETPVESSVGDAPDASALQEMFDTQLDNNEPEVEATAEPEQNQQIPVDATSRVGRFLQRTADRLENGANHADTASNYLTDKTELAKTKLRGIGRSALARLKSAGLITLGIGVMSAGATTRGVKQAAEATKAGTAKFSEKAGDGFITGMKKVESGMDKAGAAMVSAQEKYSDFREARREAKQERIEAAKERARQAKEAALARKAERRAKWAARRDAVKQYGRDVKEGFVEARDAAVNGAKYVNATVKTNAEFAGAATRELTREQKAKLGRFAARARAAGEGAVEGWKSV